MKSSRQRFLLLMLAAMLLVAAVAIPRVYGRTERAWRRLCEQMLRDKVVILARSIDLKHPRVDPTHWPRLEASTWGTIFELYDGEGHPWVGPKVTDQAGRPLPLPDPNFLREPVLVLHPETTLGPVRSATFGLWPEDKTNSRPQAIARVLLPLSERRADTGPTLFQIISGGGLFIMVVILAIDWISRRWLDGLRRVAQTARRLGAQTWPHERLPTTETEPELAEFAEACNQMLDRLEAVHATRQRFVADAAHELRTPLTILRGEIDVVLRREREPERYRRVLASNREEIERLTHLLDSLLLLARADAGRAVARVEAVAIAAVCRDVVDRARPLAERQEVELHFLGGPDGATVLGDPVALGQALGNLVQNALQHTPAGERVEVSYALDEAEVRMEVRDTGVGIPESDQSQLFQRFFRVERNRAATPNGAGLGLAIVRALVEAHHGRVTVSSRVGEGSTFTIRLPREHPTTLSGSNEAAGGAP